MKPGAKILGAAEGEAWLEERGLTPVPHWYLEIEVRTDDPQTSMTINIYPEEWGFVFRRGLRVSSIRITDVPFVHGADDDRLLAQTPSLETFGELLAKLEQRFDVTFHPLTALVHTNLIRAAAVVRPWLSSRPRASTTDT